MMGSNSEGQLGIMTNCPDFQNQDYAGAPCLVDTFRDFKVESVQCGSNFTYAIVNESLDSIVQSAVYAWGCNGSG